MLSPYRWTFKMHTPPKHPWVFKQDLTDVVRGTPPGSVVDLYNPKGKFLCKGFGNLNSQIAFRKISEDPKLVIDREWLIENMLTAWKAREAVKYTQHSFRWIFSEADDLPGLIVDYFKAKDDTAVISFQVLTAGMEQLLGDPKMTFTKVLSALTLNPENHLLLIKNKSSVREKEGLMPGQNEAITLGSKIIDSKKFRFLITGQVELACNLYDGQKTGFFLDQSMNLQQTLRLLTETSETVKILDLFCYVGQWGTYLGRKLQEQNKKVETCFVDASENALTWAKQNGEYYELSPRTVKADIIQKPQLIPDELFDIVICDPPALIKNKKDFFPGRKGYLKANREAMKRTQKGGLLLSCSCSQPLTSQDLKGVLNEAAKNENRTLTFLGESVQGPDHPVHPHFPQGHYLKMHLVRVD
ncbi:MAG: class I SAM-dependent rRNA methyltransferase [Bacteriovoracaceae bacterium]|nr:class I SAM-dependent rRNA methyltransferase [Bacteriovoracaceae bacterium]